MSNERVTCVVLIGYGLSLEGVAEVDQEGPPGEAEKAMATHSSTLAWKILWMEEPGRLQSMGSLRVRHD